VSLNHAINYLQLADVIFWDFDGVIKDSVKCKTKAFETLFLPYGDEVAAKICAHHEANGGISRFEKIPLYLSWAGLTVSDDQIEKYCENFSKIVLEGVINSPWVLGVNDYLLQHYKQQYFILVTATPQKEIELIIGRLNINHCFREIYGAPKSKAQAIANVLKLNSFDSEVVLMIGDSETDLNAAKANGIPFLLRRTNINLELQTNFDVPMFENLTL